MTKASKCIKLKPSISSLKPWESDGISRNAWYRKGRLAAGQIDVSRPGAGDKSSATPFNFEGMKPREIAGMVLLKMASGEIPASTARVAACRVVLKLAENGDDCGLGDAGGWADALDGRS
jgi:hypothetical protein